MANLVVTSTTNSIKVVFNDYSASIGFLQTAWAKTAISDIRLHSTFVEVIANDVTFTVSYDGNGNAMQIDTIDSVVPSSNADLYNKLIALIA